LLVKETKRRKKKKKMPAIPTLPLVFFKCNAGKKKEKGGRGRPRVFEVCIPLAIYGREKREGGRKKEKKEGGG